MMTTLGRLHGAAVRLAALVVVLLASTADGEVNVTTNCLVCICTAMSNCETKTRCAGDVCGLFKITKPYWVDAGNITLDDNKTPDELMDFANCVTTPSCAVRVVQAYMNKNAKDCNEDLLIDCDDFMSLHRNGPEDCGSPLPEDVLPEYSDCKNRLGVD